jgi:hypothetical protein
MNMLVLIARYESLHFALYTTILVCTNFHVVWDESLKAEYICLAVFYWAQRSIRIKFYDFKWQMNSSSHFVVLSQVRIINLSSSDTVSLSSFMNYRTTVATFNLSLSDQLGACTDRPIFWMSCCGRYCGTGCQSLSPSICGACGCCIGLFWWGELRE